MSNNSQQGFAHLALILLAVGVIGLIFLSNYQNLVKLQEAQKGEVAGALIAEGGDHFSQGVPQPTQSSHEENLVKPTANSHEPSASDSHTPAPVFQGDEHHSEPPHSVDNHNPTVIRVTKEFPHPTGSFKSVGGRIENHEASQSGVNQHEDNNTEVENEIEKPEVKKIELNHTGHGLDVRVHEATGESRKVEASGSGVIDKIMLNTKKGGKEIEVELRGENFRIKVSSQSAQTRFPISFDPTTGVLSVQTPSGIKQVNILPDQVQQIAETAGIDQSAEPEIVEENNPQTSDEIAFKVQGTRQVKLFALIPMTETLQTEIGAQSGQILSTNEPWWAKFLSLK